MTPFYHYANNCMLRGVVNMPYYDVFFRNVRHNSFYTFIPIYNREVEVLEMNGPLFVYHIATRITHATTNHNLEMVSEWVGYFNNWMVDLQ